MRIRTLALLTSFAAFACGGDDDDSTTNNTTATDTDVTTTMSTTDATATLTTTDGTESSSSAGETLTTTENPESSGPGESSDSGSSGSADSGSSGSESGGSSATCESYCTAYELNCANDGDQYDDHQDCLDTCNAWDAGSPGDASGNTQECHLYHASAASGDPGTHCPHAQENAVAGGCV